MTRDPSAGAGDNPGEAPRIGQAFVWLNRILSGAMSPQEVEGFKTWRAADPQHAAAFAEALRLRNLVRDAVRGEREGSVATPAVATAPRRSSSARRGEPQRRGPSRRAVLGGAVAAAGAGVAILNARDLWEPAVAAWTGDYRTAHGERRSLAPAAGVSLELNTNTSIARSDAGRSEDERGDAGLGDGLRLLSGELALNVAPRAVPFTVEARGARLRLAGGDADIRILREGGCVTCASGEVEVLHPAGVVRVPAGRQLLFTPRALGAVTPVDLAAATGWRRGLLIFRDAPLQTVVDELNRYRPGRIVLANARLARRPVFGVFQLDQLDHAVVQVERLTGARATPLAAGWVVLS